MAKGRNALGLVLDALRAGLASGRIAPGAPLNIGDIAERHRISVTPVREALCQLAGEGLVTGARRQGYSAARLDAVDVADLYVLQGLEIGWAATRDPAGVEEEACDAALAPRPRVERLFERLITRARNAALRDAYRRTRARLGPVIVAEAAVFPDLADEAQRLATAGRAGAGALRDALGAFHTRREAAAEALALAAARPPQLCGPAEAP